MTDQNTGQHLITDDNLQDYDSVYQNIIDMFEGLSEAEYHKASAKLIFMLANHIGDEKVILEAVSLARQNTLEWREDKNQ